ncbi:hypothetical protein HDU67_008849 [Dinochytrium kinnereticum]|nr:hypothetical protein HDU67_008849 [Dinochytrium kinnereticum]
MGERACSCYRLLHHISSEVEKRCGLDTDDYAFCILFGLHYVLSTDPSGLESSLARRWMLRVSRLAEKHSFQNPRIPSQLLLKRIVCIVNTLVSHGELKTAKIVAEDLLVNSRKEKDECDFLDVERALEETCESIRIPLSPKFESFLLDDWVVTELEDRPAVKPQHFGPRLVIPNGTPDRRFEDNIGNILPTGFSFPYFSHPRDPTSSFNNYPNFHTPIRVNEPTDRIKRIGCSSGGRGIRSESAREAYRRLVLGSGSEDSDGVTRPLKVQKKKSTVAKKRKRVKDESDFDDDESSQSSESDPEEDEEEDQETIKDEEEDGEISEVETSDGSSAEAAETEATVSYSRNGTFRLDSTSDSDSEVDPLRSLPGGNGRAAILNQARPGPRRGRTIPVFIGGRVSESQRKMYDRDFVHGII